MSVERAQKSEVHERTDDASSSPSRRQAAETDRANSPASNFERAAAETDVAADTGADATLTAGPGASDGYSGGGPGSNNPDAETALRANPDVLARGDAEADRRKLFPDAPAAATENAAADELRVTNDPDESSFGGPLRIDDATGRPGGK
jgi:hypothetical protein